MGKSRNPKYKKGPRKDLAADEDGSEEEEVQQQPMRESAAGQ
jgi:hypothetical protein